MSEKSTYQDLLNYLLRFFPLSWPGRTRFAVDCSIAIETEPVLVEEVSSERQESLAEEDLIRRSAYMEALRRYQARLEEIREEDRHYWELVSYGDQGDWLRSDAYRL